MDSECLRIADQLRRAFTGDPWHGSPLRDLLTGITAGQAGSRPLPSAHTIWELVLHIEIYVNAAFEAMHGTPMPRLFDAGRDWPKAGEGGAAGWTGAVDRLFHAGDRLAHGIERFTDLRLHDTVPGREYNFYYLFHGIVQHSLYHGGQIAMLKRAVPALQSVR